MQRNQAKALEKKETSKQRRKEQLFFNAVFEIVNERRNMLQKVNSGFSVYASKVL